VAHVLPRHWDGRRLLRFLTGLAMLALAWTVPAAIEPAPPVPIVRTATAESGPITETAAETVTEIPAAIGRPLPPAPVTVPLVVLVAVILVPAGLALRVRAERAPPAR
jgi:hypothetical protein